MGAKSPSAGQVGDYLAGEQLCQKGSRAPGRHHGAVAEKRTSSLLGCVSRCTLRRLREVIVVKLHLDTASSFGSKLEGPQQRTTKLVRQEHWPCEDRAIQPGEEMACGGRRATAAPSTCRKVIEKTEVGSSQGCMVRA